MSPSTEGYASNPEKASSGNRPMPQDIENEDPCSARRRPAKRPARFLQRASPPKKARTEPTKRPSFERILRCKSNKDDPVPSTSRFHPAAVLSSKGGAVQSTPTTSFPKKSTRIGNRRRLCGSFEVDLNLSCQSKRKGKTCNFPKNVTTVLWDYVKKHLSNPYPNGEELRRLVNLTSLDEGQVTQWFTNMRRRKPFKKLCEARGIVPSTNRRGRKKSRNTHDKEEEEEEDQEPSADDSDAESLSTSSTKEVASDSSDEVFFQSSAGSPLMVNPLLFLARVFELREKFDNMTYEEKKARHFEDWVRNQLFYK